jgi:protein-tyrosine phosphatase
MYMKPDGGHYVDIHCHCLAGVDDGPATLSESLSLCRALVDDGVTDVIATPHQLGRFNNCNHAAQVREQVAALNAELESDGVGLNVLPGGDVRVDERICQLLDDDRILTLADGGRYILLELPHEVFIDVDPLLMELSSRGIQAIISHPERHPMIARSGGPAQSVLRGWLAHSACLQVTCGSLLGDFGPVAQEAAWCFLTWGWASLVATDSHDLDNRRPRMSAAFGRIAQRLGQDVARLVCIENPLRVVEGKEVSLACSKRERTWIDERVPSSS